MSSTTDIASKIIRTAVYDVGVNGAKALAYTQAPWLKTPVVRHVFEYLLGKFADLIYTALDNAVVLAIIDIETQAQRKAYEEAVASLKEALKPVSGGLNPDAIAKAEAEFKKRLADLIRMRP